MKNESLFIEIPVVQFTEDGERVALELIAPKYITRLSQTKNGTVIWLAHQTPYVRTPLSYNEVLEILRQGKVEDNERGPRELLREFTRDIGRRLFG